eukprot:6407262-Prymnesium_polylepis.2
MHVAITGNSCDAGSSIGGENASRPSIVAPSPRHARPVFGSHSRHRCVVLSLHVPLEHVAQVELARESLAFTRLLLGLPPCQLR